MQPALAPKEALREEIEAMLLFADIVELGSYTAAGERHGLSRSAVSKRVGRLEERLGLRLLHRTTRRVSPTEAGNRLLIHCHRLEAVLDEVEADLGTLATEPAGLVRINAPVQIGQALLPAAFAAFQARHPKVRISLTLADHRVDPVALGLDLIIRIGPIEDEGFVARPLVRFAVCTVASPAYLARRGTPEHPADLSRHDGLHYLNISQEREWLYEVEGQHFSARVRAPFETDSGQAIRGAALAGIGIGHLPAFYVADDIQSGRLVQLLSEFEHPPIPAHLIYPSRKHQPAAVRALLSFLPEWFVENPPPTLDSPIS